MPASSKSPEMAFFASKRHARLFYRAGRFWLQDLNSTNGTEVNGRRLRGEAVPLEPGAEIRFGVYGPVRFEMQNR